MRRFIKTLTVSRSSMFVVRQDSDRHHYEVMRWGADDDQPVTLATYTYTPGDVATADDVRMTAARDAAVTNMTARFAVERDERRFATTGKDSL